MKNLKTQLAFLLLTTLCLLTGAYGQVTPSADSYTNTADPTANYGAKTLLDVDGATQTTYIQFNLSSIPAGASVSQATLKLYVNAVTTTGSFNVDYVNGAWSESTITSNLAPALGTTIVSSVPVTAADKNQYILINITPVVVAWLNGSQANYGIALVADGTFNASFDSKESTTTSHPAEMDIVFASGSGGGITGITTASGSGLIGGGTSGTLNLSLTQSCATSQVLQWSGTAWVCANLKGSGTITGVTAGTDLTGGGTSGTVTLNVDTTKVPQLAAVNTFTGNQTVNGNLSATGTVTGNSYQIGSNLFAFGSFANGNASLGFAGNSTMTGGSNIALGFGSLASDSTGNSNTAVGATSMGSNTTGNENTASGFHALYKNTTGTNNTASGSGALYSNTTASTNTATGWSALSSNTTGGGNTGDGGTALSTNTTGFYNTASGFGAGTTLDSSNITANNDTLLGAGTALTTGTVTNATAIGSNAVVGESNALVLGSVKGAGAGTANVNVGIGTTTPAYSLDVHGTGSFTAAVAFGSPVTFAQGQTFPGAGTITGVTAGSGLTGGGNSGSVTLGLASNACAAGSAISALPFTCSPFATLAANTFTASQNVTGNITASGDVQGSVISANSSFKIGGTTFALGNSTLQNAYLGFAGNSTTTGQNNTASGWEALVSNTTGGYNEAAGNIALFFNTTGNFNTADGVQALLSNAVGSENTASGYAALYSNNGSNNTASGFLALSNNTTGASNTALGSNAGQTADSSKLTANNNSAVGAGSSFSTGTLQNASAIGANAEVASSNAIVLGSIIGVNGATSNVAVGIGTTTPAATLDVRDNGSGNNTISAITSALNNAVYGSNTATSGSGANGGMFITSSPQGSGIVAQNTGTGGTDYAAYLVGNVFISGNVSKGGGSFKIDHPLDPANKYLYHSFVESPDMMNVYNGNIVTNRRGVATVILPDYFEALNRDFRYQLTVIGQFAQAIVATKIGRNRFVIRTSKPNVEVSWQVTGVRHDAYADAHRIQVEEDKPPQEQGRYLHPELFGATPEQAIGYHGPESGPRVAQAQSSSLTNPLADPLAKSAGGQISATPRN